MEQKFDNLHNVNNKQLYKQVGFFGMHQIVTFITFKKLLSAVLELGFNSSIQKPKNPYVRDLMIDTQNAVTTLDTYRFSTLKNTTYEQLKTLQTFYTKDNYIH